MHTVHSDATMTS